MNGKVTACNTGAVVISSGAVTATLSATDNAVLDAIDAVLDTIKVDTEAIETAVESLDGKVTACNTGAVVISSGAVTATLSATDNAVLDTIAGDTTSLDGKVTACNTGAVVISSGAVTATLSATDNAVLDTIAGDTTSLDGKVTACNTGAVVISSGAVTATLSATDNAVLDASLVKQTNIETLITSTNSKIDTFDAVLDTISSNTADLENVNGKIVACNTGAVVISSGAVTASLSATDNAVLDAMESSLNSLISANHTDFGTLDTTTQGVADAIETMDAVLDNVLTKLGEIETTNNANEVLLTNANGKLADIETAVQLIDNGYGAMTTETIMNASVADSSAEGVSSVFTKTREIENVAFSIKASADANYSAFIEYSVDNVDFFQDTNLNFGNTLACGGSTLTIGRGFRYYRVRIINNHGVAQTFVVKASY